MHTFLIIIPNGGMLFEAIGVTDILMHANRLRTTDTPNPPYQVTVATTQPHRVVNGISGLNLLADQRLSDLDPTLSRNTIMVTGKGLTEDESSNVVSWLKLAEPHAERIVSICGGALLLAKAGLLDGRHATTHWRLLDTLQTQYPRIMVERGPLYVQDGMVWTSGGSVQVLI